jgi:hypothetical protein
LVRLWLQLQHQQDIHVRCLLVQLLVQQPQVVVLLLLRVHCLAAGLEAGLALGWSC